MSLESKILDGKAAGYCSSSDGEDESGFRVVNDEDEHQANVMRQFGPSSNTGAKGVLNDFKQFREQTRLAVEQKNMALLEQAKRGMMIGSKEEREKAQNGDVEDEELLLDEIRARRFREMKKLISNKMVEITNKDQYTDAIDGSSSYLLCTLIYETGNDKCDRFTILCKLLAADYPHVKFIRATSTLLGMSDAFRVNGVPCLQFYADGNLIGNFVNIATVLGDDCDVAKLKTFLRRQHIDLASGKFGVESDDDADEDDD